MTSKIQRLAEIYKGSVPLNLDDIKAELDEHGLGASVFEKYRDVLVTSSEMIVSKWESGEKYIRTQFVTLAFGDRYPKDRLETSIAIDAMINILDDLLDERLTEDQKKLYVLEYLRAFSVFSKQQVDESLQEDLGTYFNKLITLAIAEGEFLERVKAHDDLGAVVDDSFELLLIRSLDIDVFVELAAGKGVNDEKLARLKQAARLFRTINMLKKDIIDIDHDRENEQETMVIHILDRDDVDFEEYIELMAKKIDEEWESLRSDSSKTDVVIENFHRLTQEDMSKLIEHSKAA